MSPLTARQREVLRLVAAGYTNAQPAPRLKTKQATVARHLAEIYKRLAVHDRAHAVAVAIYLGEISLADLAAIGQAHTRLTAVPKETAA